MPPADSPLPADLNGRAARGRFGRNNKFGRGNPNNRRAQEIRNALIGAITPEGMAKAATALLKLAKQGDRAAFAELADRALGKPSPSSVEERVAAIEDCLGIGGQDDQ